MLSSEETVADLAFDYWRRALEGCSARELDLIEKLLSRYIVPRLGDLLVARLQGEDVLAFLAFSAAVLPLPLTAEIVHVLGQLLEPAQVVLCCPRCGAAGFEHVTGAVSCASCDWRVVLFPPADAHAA